MTARIAGGRGAYKPNTSGRKGETMNDYDDMNKDYARERNALIPEAEAFANKKCKTKFPGGNEKAREAWAAKWNFTFHNRVNKLWRERQNAEK